MCWSYCLLIFEKAKSLPVNENHQNDVGDEELKLHLLLFIESFVQNSVQAR